MTALPWRLSSSLCVEPRDIVIVDGPAAETPRARFAFWHGLQAAPHNAPGLSMLRSYRAD